MRDEVRSSNTLYRPPHAVELPLLNYVARDRRRFRFRRCREANCCLSCSPSGTAAEATMFRATRCTRRSEQRCLAKRIANEIQSAEQDVRAVAVAALVDKGL